MEGDDYWVRDALKQITDRVQVGYQQAALQQILVRKRYSSQARVNAPDNVTLIARRS